jgi:hypothetical protein
MNIPQAKRKLYKQASPDEPIFEPFPEPRTFPSGWDLGGLFAQSTESEERNGIVPTPSLSDHFSGE